MRTSLAVPVGAALLLAAPLAMPAPASAQAVAGSKYTVCNFDDPSVPKANRQYPFRFMLSTALANTTRPKVRKAVRSVQEVLRAVPIRDDQGRRVVVDGSYGPQTAQAVTRFQRRQSLVVDGKVGPQTWRRLGNKYCWRFH
ncbi:MAG TPA: peptidoglycan-binding domain-containing protein [Actinomycetota bacterium]|nr:peptidoglycan-binding domain-containing protein [Actinomycetota bacterium]